MVARHSSDGGKGQRPIRQLSLTVEFVGRLESGRQSGQVGQPQRNEQLPLAILAHEAALAAALGNPQQPHQRR